MISAINTTIRNNTDEHLHYRFTRVEIPLGAKGEDNDYYVMNGDVFTKLMDEEAAQLIADHRLGNITLTYDVDAVVPTINDHGVIPEYRRLNPVLQARGDLPVEGGSVKREFRMAYLEFRRQITTVIPMCVCDECEKSDSCQIKEECKKEAESGCLPKCEKCWKITVKYSSQMPRDYIKGARIYINDVGPYFTDEKRGELNTYIEDSPTGWDVRISSDGYVDFVYHIPPKPLDWQLGYTIAVPPARPEQQFLVVDETGKEVEGASIFIEEYGTKTTDEHGFATFKRLPFLAIPHPKEEAPAEEAAAATEELERVAEVPPAEPAAEETPIEQVNAIEAVSGSGDSQTPEYDLSYYVLKKGYQPFEGVLPAEPDQKKAHRKVWIVVLKKLEEYKAKGK